MKAKMQRPLTCGDTELLHSHPVNFFCWLPEALKPEKERSQEDICTVEEDMWRPCGMLVHVSDERDQKPSVQAKSVFS